MKNKSLWKDDIDISTLTDQRADVMLTGYVGRVLQRLTAEHMKEETMVHLKTCPNLKELSLLEGYYTSNHFLHLPPTLTYLKIEGLYGCQPTDDWYVAFTQEHFPNLETLCIRDFCEFDEALKKISHLKTLRTLEFKFMNDGISDEAFDAMMTMTDLEHLTLVCIDRLPADSADEILKNLLKLKSAYIDCTWTFGPEGVRTLAKLPNLQKLTIPADDEPLINELPGILHVADKLQRLEFDPNMDFHETGVPQGMAEIVKQLKELRPDVVFIFRGHKVGEKELVKIKKLEWDNDQVVNNNNAVQGNNNVVQGNNIVAQGNINVNNNNIAEAGGNGDQNGGQNDHGGNDGDDNDNSDISDDDDSDDEDGRGDLLPLIMMMALTTGRREGLRAVVLAALEKMQDGRHRGVMRLHRRYLMLIAMILAAWR